DRDAFTALINRSMRGLAWLAVAGGLTWVLMAPAVMTGVYGSAFAPAGAALQALACGCVVAALSGPCRCGLIAGGRHDARAAGGGRGSGADFDLIRIRQIRVERRVPWFVGGGNGGLVDRMALRPPDARIERSCEIVAATIARIDSGFDLAVGHADLFCGRA